MSLTSSAIWIVGYLFVIAVVGAAVGVRVFRIPEIARRVVPLSGGLLTGIALFWIAPEIAGRSGWGMAGAGLAGGFGLLWAIDRFALPVCPDEHGHAGPLISAGCAHAFFDGWSVAAAQGGSGGGFRAALAIGIGLHKLPEGLALGVLLLRYGGSAWRAWAIAVAVQSAMWVGLAAGLALAGPGSGALLALAGGVFGYLGYHAVEDAGTGWRPALAGLVGAGLLRLLPDL